mgnify:CR=1 FL=1
MGTLTDAATGAAIGKCEGDSEGESKGHGEGKNGATGTGDIEDDINAGAATGYSESNGE